MSATLVLTENRGVTSSPVPPDRHEIAHYAADLTVAPDDFDRPAAFVACIETDANLQPQVFAVDVTDAVAAAAGGTIGFRIKLAVDPALTDFAALGSAFSDLTTNPPRIEIDVA